MTKIVMTEFEATFSKFLSTKELLNCPARQSSEARRALKEAAEEIFKNAERQLSIALDEYEEKIQEINQGRIAFGVKRTGLSTLPEA